MILVDTSVWVEHLRGGNVQLTSYLHADLVVGHALVTGELALGRLRNRQATLSLMTNLPQAPRAEHDEVLALIDRRALYASGCGWVDVNLLASTFLAPELTLWTRDKSLAALAGRFDKAHVLS